MPPGYASGLIALLMPEIRALGWIEARERMLSDDQPTPHMVRATASNFSVVYGHSPRASAGFWMLGLTPAAEAASTRELLFALALARHVPTLAGQAAALDRLKAIAPSKRSAGSP